MEGIGKVAPGGTSLTFRTLETMPTVNSDCF